MKLYVGNLPYNTTEDDLRNLFSQYGSVDSVAVITDRETGRSKGFGFVEFGNDSEARNAIQALSGQEWRTGPDGQRSAPEDGRRRRRSPGPGPLLTGSKPDRRLRAAPKGVRPLFLFRMLLWADGVDESRCIEGHKSTSVERRVHTRVRNATGGNS